jgi:hypothetical protein
MSPAVLTFLVLGVLTTIVVGVRAAIRSSRVGKLRRIAPTKANALPAGDQPVRVVGTVRVIDGTTVAAPYTGRTGVVAVYELWETSRGEKVHRVDRHVVHTAFLVEDETGTVRVGGDHVDALLQTSPIREKDADAGAFGAGVVAANQTAASAREEAVLKAGDRVAVVGRLVDGVLVGSEQAPLVVSDHPSLL